VHLLNEMSFLIMLSTPAERAGWTCRRRWCLTTRRRRRSPISSRRRCGRQRQPPLAPCRGDMQRLFTTPGESPALGVVESHHQTAVCAASAICPPGLNLLSRPKLVDHLGFSRSHKSWHIYCALHRCQVPPASWQRCRHTACRFVEFQPCLMVAPGLSIAGARHAGHHTKLTN